MKKNLLLALVLVSGVALAQSSGTSGPSGQQQPSAQQPSTGQQPTQPPAAPPSAAPGSQTATGQGEMKGCLKQSGGNWVLAAENGQTVNLSGDSSMLKPHDGHQVQVQGTQASDGSFQVSSVSMISDSCTSPR